MRTTAGITAGIPDRAGSAFRAVLLLLALAGIATRARAGEDEALEGLRAKVCAGDKWVRAEAVGELARLGTPGAFELVLAALSDPKGEVADVAELVLVGFTHEKACELLGGVEGLRSKETLVRARVAELLGRAGKWPVTAAFLKLLERALADDEPPVRRMAAWSIERGARERRFADEARARFEEGLAKHARADRDPLVRARALAALVALAPETARPLLAAYGKDREAPVRAAAAQAFVALLEPKEAAVRLSALVGDGEVAVRRVVLEALAQRPSKASAGVLVERLSLENEERLLGRIVTHLRRFSGRKDRRDPRPWRDWWKSLPEDWKPGPTPAAPLANPEQRSSSALAGLPIVSRRVAILIDLSGSIWNVRPDGKTRKELVDTKLREALEALPSETRFNLIPYTSAPIPWKPRLVSATPANVRTAATWFEARRENGSGNLWDAVELALEDPEVDTLVVLFDGAPTGGPHHRLELMVPLFLEQNEFRRVAFDFVLVDGTNRLRKAWSELSEGSGGALVAVTF